MDAKSADKTNDTAVLSVVIGLGVSDANLERLDNARVALSVLNRQSLERERYRIMIVEQGPTRRIGNDILRMADEHVFAYNPGPFNRSWSLNIGAVRAGAPLLCLFDADIVVPVDFLRSGYLAWQCGMRAFRPFSEMLYMDADSSARVRELAAGEQEIDCYDSMLRGDIHPWNRGGCTWVDTHLYTSIGGHDERFVGWGDEDREFWDRLNAATEVISLHGRVLHLYHEPVPPNGPLPRANRLLYRAIQAGTVPKTSVPIGDVNRYRKVVETTSEGTRELMR